jgi:hypothetical protein
MAEDMTTNSAKKKNAPTPKRKEAEQKNFRPIVGGTEPKKKLTKEEKQERKRQRNLQIQRENEAMKTGDQRYMPERDKGKDKKFIRNYIDNRRSLAEFFLPVAVITLIASVVLNNISIVASFYFTLFIYVYLVVTIIHIYIQTRGLKRELSEKYGEKAVAKGSGYLSYALGRMVQPRYMRLPKRGV